MRAAFRHTHLFRPHQKGAAVAKRAVENQEGVTEDTFLGFQRHCSMCRWVFSKSLDKPELCIPYKIPVQNSDRPQLRVKVLVQIQFSTELSL